MALSEFIKKMFDRKQKDPYRQYAKFLDGYSPIFSQFGESIYTSDIVQMCIDVIATEISKLQPKHIRTDANGMKSEVNSSLNRLFKFAPNELMTTRDFLEKIVWQLYLNYNCFIYAQYENNPNGQSRTYTGLYPLNPKQVDFLQDDSGELFIKMYFAQGDSFTLPYSDVIHIRKKFSINSIMGGGITGQPDNQALLDTLTINDTVMQGIGKAIKASLSIRGILKINSMLNKTDQESEREKFESAITSNKSGIMLTDAKGEYLPIQVNPKMIDQHILDFLQSKVLNHFGVSLPILSGDYTDEQYQAFYEKTLEPIIIALGQATSKSIFSARELAQGNEIVYYTKNLSYLSAKAKVELIKVGGEQGIFTLNQKLDILGYPPVGEADGGNIRHVSLNFIDSTLANDYQMKNAGNKGVLKSVE